MTKVTLSNVNNVPPTTIAGEVKASNKMTVGKVFDIIEAHNHIEYDWLGF